MSNTYAHRPFEVAFPNGGPTYQVVTQFSNEDKFLGLPTQRTRLNRQERYSARRALARNGIEGLDTLPTRSTGRSRAKWLSD